MSSLESTPSVTLTSSLSRPVRNILWKSTSAMVSCNGVWVDAAPVETANDIKARK